MVNKRDLFQAERLKAIKELEKKGKDAYLPVNAWVFDLSVIKHADLSPAVKAQYRREMVALIKAGIDPFDFEALQKYAESMKPYRRIRLRLALRLISKETERKVKASATPENLAIVQAVLMRLEAMQENARGKGSRDAKAHIWLSPAQVQEITGLCTDDLEGRRDWIILGLLLGAGLHRAELVTITFDALKKQTTKRGEIRDVLEITGRGANDRVIPISSVLASRLRTWQKVVGDGYIVCSLKKGKKLSNSISTVAVYQIVRKYGVMIGVPGLTAQDLRRTYAHLAYNSGIPITQIKEMLGHASMRTTESFLGLTVDLDNITGDFVPLTNYQDKPLTIQGINQE